MYQSVTWKLNPLSVQQAETQRSIHSYASRIELRDQLHAFASTIFAGGDILLVMGGDAEFEAWTTHTTQNLGAIKRHSTYLYFFFVSRM